MSVWVAFCTEPDRYRYQVEVIARPEGVAHADELPYASAEVSVTGAPPGADLLLELVEAAPNGVPAAEALAQGRTLLLYAYHPRDVAQMLDFDSEVNDAYLAFHTPRGEHYAGVFHPQGLSGEGWLAELCAFDADTREQAESLIPADTLTDDIKTILADCRAYQDTDRARYIVWLTLRER